MGRLQTVAALFVGIASLTCACDESKPTPTATNKRSEAVIGSGSTPSPRSTPSQPTASAPAKSRVLCPGPSLNRSMPNDKLGHAEAPGAPPLSDNIATGNGKWAWINLWAAWCVPCKEEMPRLLQWQSRLSSNLTLHFVSLDDDQRQLNKFLETQPASGVRSSFWLPEGNTRESWLTSLRIKTTPQLPVQILVNPQGKVHCIIEGAVEDSDFAQVSAIVGQR